MNMQWILFLEVSRSINEYLTEIKSYHLFISNLKQAKNKCTEILTVAAEKYLKPLSQKEKKKHI